MSELGTVLDLTPTAAKEAVVARVNEHAAMLKGFDGTIRTASERAEMVERLAASMQEEIKALKSQERLAWSPGGNATDLDHRYIRADGLVQVADKEISERFLGVEVKHRAPGLLTADRGVTHEHERLIQAYRRYALAKTMQGRGWVGASELLPRYAAEFLRAARSMPGRVGEQLRAMLADEASYQRVLNGASGSGAEMISNPTIAAIRKPLLLARRVAGLIPSQPVTTPTFKQSHATGHGLARKRGATADDPARFRRQNFSTTDTSITVQNLVINALVDPAWLRDAASTIDDPMGEVLMWLEQAMVDTKEVLFLHGDTAATHQDTVSTWTLGSYFTAGDLDGTDSPVKLFIGARARAFDDSAATGGAGAFTAALHFGALATMGNHSNGAVMVCGLNAFYAGILANALFTTVDKFGPQATLITGQMGSVGDTPIVISEFMPKEFDTSSGLYTGSNAGNEILYTRPESWRFYDMPSPDESFDVTYPERGARYVGMGMSTALAPVVVSGEKPAYVLYYTP